MRTAALAIALTAFAPLSFANAQRYCPLLPVGTAVKWTYQQAPDFGVCLAGDKKSKKVKFGIYLGYHPSFHPSKERELGSGNIGGKSVTWYRPDPTDSSPGTARETIFPIGQNGLVAHAWVSQGSETEVATALSILEKVVFRWP